ncbi:MAG: peptidoglycan DD-metalloendopeptidase family protein [Wenzhouxiangellaceae bacterium]|nr:peptidoglycan DD-metalloendopeptidase family protein [Wenzhouxiangellaceae bacterium]
MTRQRDRRGAQGGNRLRPARCVPLAAVLVLALLAACGAPRPIPREQRHTPSSPMQYIPAPEVYRVVQGDTLFSIAFRYGLDWRAVALWNHIPPPYTIRAGQWVKLSPPPNMRSAVLRREPRVADRAEAPATAPEPEPAAAGRSATNHPEPATRPAAGSASASSTGASTTGPGTPASNSPASNSTVSESPASSSPAAGAPAPGSPAPGTGIPAAATRSSGGVEWRWPAEGRLARGFDAGQARKGILIAGAAGQPVRAAADGDVVYSGNGLIGYGELIIVKHSDRMLSAYAHNRERLVSEGQRVRAGQIIARLGRNERDQEVLHFEIRRDGKPDDPLKYLPPR